MVVFPLIATIVSAACAGVIAYDAWRRPKPDRIVWAIAFLIFALAAGSEVIASFAGWSPALVRVFYLGGAVLVVGYLALGELYLLARPKVERIAPGATLLITALAATLVINAPIDDALLEEEGWEALERGPALVAMAVSINAIGTIVLVAGALYSAVRFRRLGIQRHRMIGCILIAAGTLVVASGGTLTRFGQREFLYIAMSIGVAMIFAGVLETRRSDVPSSAAGLASGGILSVLPSVRRDSELRVLPGSANGDALTRSHRDEGIAFVLANLLPLADDDLDRECTKWSVPRRSPFTVFERGEARAVWDFRLQLPSEIRAQFDRMPIEAQLQMTELYDEVLSHRELTA